MQYTLYYFLGATGYSNTIRRLWAHESAFPLKYAHRVQVALLLKLYAIYEKSKRILTFLVISLITMTIYYTTFVTIIIKDWTKYRRSLIYVTYITCTEANDCKDEEVQNFPRSEERGYSYGAHTKDIWAEKVYLKDSCKQNNRVQW